MADESTVPLAWSAPLKTTLHPGLLGSGTELAEEGQLFVVGDLGSEHPQDRVQLLLVVLLLNGNRTSQSSDDRLIHSFNRVVHRFPDLGEVS
jgi:hypothetical protein